MDAVFKYPAKFGLTKQKIYTILINSYLMDLNLSLNLNLKKEEIDRLVKETAING